MNQKLLLICIIALKFIITQPVQLQILPYNYQNHVGSSFSILITLDFTRYPQQMQTDTLIFDVDYFVDIKTLKVQLFDNYQVNLPNMQISTLQGVLLNVPFTFANNVFLATFDDALRLILKNNSFQKIQVKFDNITNISTSNCTHGAFQMTQTTNSAKPKVFTLTNQSTNLFLNINQCQLILVKLLSSQGSHMFGNLTFSIDFSYNMIFQQQDGLLLTFNYQEYIGASQTLSFPPSDFTSNLQPFDDITQINAWVQQIYSNSPQIKLNVKVIDSQSILITGFQNIIINNPENYIDQEIILTLSNIYQPPTVQSKLIFDMYLIDSVGYFKCEQQVSLIQSNTSPFLLFNANFSSIYYGSPLKLNFTISPQRYLLAQNNTLTLSFSDNVIMPSSQNLKITGDSFFQTLDSKITVQDNQIILQNFLSQSLSSSQSISLIFEGFSVPFFGDCVKISASNIYFNQYKQHESTFTQSIEAHNPSLALTFPDFANTTIQFNYRNQYQIPDKGFINLIFPFSFFGKQPDVSQSQSLQLFINKQNFQSQFSMINNVLTIPYSYSTALSANSQINFELNNIQNYYRTDQNQEKLQIQILDINSKVILKEYGNIPQIQPDLIYITAWQSLIQTQLLKTNNVLLSFYTNTDCSVFDGQNQNNVLIYFSTHIQITQNSVFIFQDGFSQEKQLQWTYNSANGQLNISNFTFQKNLNYTVLLQNVTFSRFQNIFNIPQIQTFGKQNLMHTTAYIQSPFQINVTDPYLLRYVQLQISNSALVGAKGNNFIFQIGLENLQILAGENIQILLDKQCDLSQLNSLTIQSSSIQIAIQLQPDQFQLDSASNKNQYIIKFQIPNNLAEQQITSDISIQLNNVNNPLYLTSISYKVNFFNLLGQIYAESFNLLNNQLEPIALNAAITYDGTQDSKLLGNKFQATLQLLSNSHLPTRGLVQINGFGESLLLSESDLKITSSLSEIKSFTFDKTSNILQFKYQNLIQDLNNLPISIDGLTTYTMSLKNFNELKLQIFDYDLEKNLVSIIAPLNVTISNLFCSSKCIKCYINSDTCVQYNFTSNSNNNSTSGNNDNNSTTGNNGNNNSTSGNNNNNSTSGNNGNNNNTSGNNANNNSTSGNNSGSQNNTNQNNSNNGTNDNNCNKNTANNFCGILGCQYCDENNCNSCIKCLSGFQLINSKCTEKQQYKLSSISVSIVLSIGISMGAFFIHNNTIICYLLLVQWAGIEIFCQIEYLRQILSDIIYHLNQQEAREQIILQIVHLVLLTFLIIFYLFTQFTFYFMRKKTSLLFNIKKQSRFSALVQDVSKYLGLIEFRFYYLSLIFQSNNFNNSLLNSQKVHNLSQNDQSNIFQDQNFLNQKNVSNSSNQLIQYRSNQNSELFNQFSCIHKQHIVFILSSIQNMFKISMISLDLSNTKSSDQTIRLYEMIGVSILLLFLHTYIIIKCLNIYKISRQVVPLNQSQNLTTFREGNQIQNTFKQTQPKTPNNEPQQTQNFMQTASYKKIEVVEQQNNNQQQSSQFQSPIKVNRRKRTKLSQLNLNEKIQAFKND